MTTNPRCDTCNKQLDILAGAGDDRAIVVCFSCEPPKSFCRTCAEKHPDH
jgi:hypothetical protein